MTRGGYSSEYVLPAKFTYHLPDGLDPAGAAPLMCAGITTYSPMKRWGVGPGKSVGIVGMGGLGHIALKLAHALGAEVVQFTRSEDKADEARALGADDVVLSTDEKQMAAQTGRFDFILDTVGAPHSVEPYMGALGMDGTLCVVGIPEGAIEVNPLSLIQGAKTLAGCRQRRHRRDPGDARLLRRTRHHRRDRTHAPRPDQRGTGPPGPQRCPLPLRPRHDRPAAVSPRHGLSGRRVAGRRGCDRPASATRRTRSDRSPTAPWPMFTSRPARPWQRRS